MRAIFTNRPVGARLRTAVAVAAGVGLIGAGLSSQFPAQALPGTNFESTDGNLVVNGAGKLDWANVTGVVKGIDLPSGSGDNSFGKGAKEDTPVPAVVSGSIPNNKSDLLRFYVAQQKLDSGEVIGHFAWTRRNTLGSANMDFELNRLSTKTANNVTALRSEGDALITFDFTKGGKAPVLGLLRWVTNGSTSQCFANNALPCWGNYVNLSNAGFADGSVNDGFSVVDPLNNNASMPSLTFGEASINFTQAGIVPTTGCALFGLASLKSRSSASFTAELKDFIAPIATPFSNCIEKTWEFSFTPKPIAGTKLFAVYTPSDNVQRTAELVLQPDGKYRIVDGDVPPGAMTYRFELRNDGDGDGVPENLVWRSDADLNTPGAQDGIETLSLANPRVTNVGGLNYEVLLTPAAAENFVGRDHALTATVREVGTNVPLVGIPVAFEKFGGTPSGCGTLSPLTGITGLTGTAATLLQSATPCTTSIRAWVDGVGGTAGFNGGEASGNASKIFVDYAIAVTPGNATNVVGTTHTFTAKLTRNTGSGPVGYAGQSLALTLNDPGATGAQLVSINGVAASGTSGLCTTKASPANDLGTCAVVIKSDKAGTVSLGVIYSTLNDSGSGTFTGTGSKLFEDYRVNVDPAEAVNEVGTPHTFTVLVERDGGGGFAPLANANVSLSLAKGATDAAFKSINGVVASGTAAACVTRLDGTCSVTILSTEPGTVVLTAAFNKTLDSGPLTRSDTGTKLYSDFRLAVTPLTAVNEVGVPHVFTVTLQRDDGPGFAGYVGQTVGLTLNRGGTDAAIVSINGVAGTYPDLTTCVTQAAGGTCLIEIVSNQPGPVTLQAAWQQVLSSTSTASRNASAEKVYLRALAAPASCPEASIPPGGSLLYTANYSVEGAPVHNAFIQVFLPAGVRFGSATPAPAVKPAVGESGLVRWDLGTLAAPSTGSVSLQLSAPTTVGPTLITGVFDGDEITPKALNRALSVTTEGSVANGRAFGIEAHILHDSLRQLPHPDTNTGRNPYVALHVDPLNGAVVVDLLEGRNDAGVDAQGATDNAIAHAVDVDIKLPDAAGGHTISADAVLAKSTSTAAATSANSTFAGSRVENLVINNQSLGDITTPQAFALEDSLGNKVGEVRVLEAFNRQGAYSGVPQPFDDFFTSGFDLNGIHVIVYDSPHTVLVDETSDIVVSRASTFARFPSGLPCNPDTPWVAGNAYALGISSFADPVAAGAPEGNPITEVLGLVTLGANGGSDAAATNVSNLSPVGTSGTAKTSTAGTVPPNGLLQAASSSIVEDLNLLAGRITSKTVQSNASARAATGSTLIEELLIDTGTSMGVVNVCERLGLQSTCAPSPNTVLLLGSNTIVMLNEQLTDQGGGGITVNAVHIWVLGDENPLDLPAGAQVIISHSYAATS